MISNFQASFDEIKNKVLEIGNGLLQSNEQILEALHDCDVEKFNNAKNFIKNVSSKADAIDNEIIKVLALYTPEAKDLRTIIAFLKATNELSRACTSTRGYIRGFTDVCNELDLEIIKEYAVPMQTSTVSAIKFVLSMIECDDNDEIQELFNEVLIQENKTDDLYEMVERNLTKQANESPDFEKFHRMLKALRKSGKIATRAISIANLLVYAKVGGNFKS